MVSQFTGFSAQHLFTSGDVLWQADFEIVANGSAAEQISQITLNMSTGIGTVTGIGASSILILTGIGAVTSTVTSTNAGAYDGTHASAYTSTNTLSYTNTRLQRYDEEQCGGCQQPGGAWF